jgi:hypothetical protein
VPQREATAAAGSPTTPRRRGMATLAAPRETTLPLR